LIVCYLHTEYFVPILSMGIDPEPISFHDVLDSEFGDMIASQLGMTKAASAEDHLRDFMENHYPILESVMDGVSLTTLQAGMNRLKATKLLSACLDWYRTCFKEGFVIVSEEEINSNLIQDLYSRDCLKSAVLWKMVIGEVARAVEDLLGKTSRPGLGLIVASDVKAQCYDGYLLFNPYFYWELSWHEAAVKMLMNAVHEYVHYFGQKVHNEPFLLYYQDLLNWVLSERVWLGDHLDRIKKVRKTK
jgi:hypothetical protein